MKTIIRLLVLVILLLDCSIVVFSQEVVFQESLKDPQASLFFNNTFVQKKNAGIEKTLYPSVENRVYETPEIDLSKGIYFLTFRYKLNKVSDVPEEMKVSARSKTNQKEQLLAIFNDATQVYSSTTLYIPSSLTANSIVFECSGINSGNMVLDDIMVICYRNANAIAIGKSVYVDTEFNLSSTFLEVPVSENQISGLLDSINPQWKTPGVPVSCPTGAFIDAEPDCYTEYIDTYNSGCPNPFTQLYGCIGVVCGKSGTFTVNSIPNRDVDQYQLLLSGPTTVTMKIVADFVAKIYILSFPYGCEGPVYNSTAAIATIPGDTATITYSTTSATSLILWVAPNTVSGVPCGSNYVMTYRTAAITNPATPVAANNPTCASTQLNPLSPQSDYTYYWQGTSCSYGTANPATAPYAVNSSGTYYVNGIYTPLGCWTSCSSVNVSINQPPVISANAFPLAVCAGGQAQLNANGATTYTWQPGNLSGSPVNVSPGSTTIYTVTGTLNGCTASNTVTVSTNPYPAAAGNISGTASLCEGTSGVSYTVATIADATSYVWSYSGTGATINGSGNNVTINFALGATSGTLTVKGSNSCGFGTVSAGYSITVKPLPTVTASADPSTVCVGSPSALTGIGNSSTYIWQPGNLSGSPVNVSPGSTTIYTVTGTLNGCTASNTVTVSTNPYPAAAGNISGTASLCEGSNSVSYNVPTITDATTYIWSYSGAGATINGSGNNVTINFALGATSGTLTVKGSNSCGFGTVSAEYSITVKPLPTVTASADPSTVCVGSPSALTGIGNSSTYIWQPGNLSGSLVNVSPGSTTMYTVTGTLNGCTASNTVTVSTNPYPAAAGTISGTSSVCEGSNSVSYNVPTITDATSYIWSYSGTGATINGTGNAVAIDFAPGATSGIITVKGSNSCGFGTVSSAYSITVKPLPLVSASAQPGLICIGQTSVLTANGNATSYSWQPGNLSGASLNVSPSSTTVFTVTADLLGCTDTSSAQITVDPCTGIYKDGISDNIKVGPIPVHDQLLIESKLSSDLEVSLFSIEGKLLSVQQFRSGAEQYFLPTDKLAASVYFLRIRAENQNLTFKIVKE